MSVKTLAQKPQPVDAGLLRDGENPFSTNKVTGYSLNYPIIGTCRPTELCGDRCYFARGPSTWRQSLAKQHRLLNSTAADPAGTAARIVEWTGRLRLSFVRWCGGGDLTSEIVACLNHAAAGMPSVPQWVVTRKPEQAAGVRPAANVYVHFSVDRGSWDRLEEMRLLASPGLRWFWSYQCARGEVPPASVAPVVFRDGYDLDGSAATDNDCPLNTAESIVGVCESCRRCFNGEAVRRAKDCRGNHQSSPLSSAPPRNGGGGR